MALIHPVVRTDNMVGTDVRAQLVSIEYLGANGATPTEIENGMILKMNGLKVKDDVTEREIYVGATPAANTALRDVVLVASPEVMYDEHKHNLDEFINPANKPARGYRLHSGATFGLTANAFDGTPEKGKIVELEAGLKLKVVSSLTSGSTKVGKIIAEEKAGRYTYFVVEID